MNQIPQPSWKQWIQSPLRSDVAFVVVLSTLLTLFGIVITSKYNEGAILGGFFFGAGVFLVTWTYLGSESRSMRVFCAAILTFGSLLRANYLFLWHRPATFVFSDMAFYINVARNWVNGHWEPWQSLKPAGYSLLVAGLMGQFADWETLLSCLHLLSSIVIVVLSWRAAVTFLGERAGAFCLLLLSFHFPLIAATGFFMPDAVFGAIITAIFWMLMRRLYPWRPLEFGAVGFLSSLANWFRGNNVLFLPIFVGWHLWRYRRGKFNFGGDSRTAHVRILAMVAGALLPTLAYAYLNHAYLKVPGFTSTNAGLSMIEGKCPAKHNKDSQGLAWLSPAFVQNEEIAEARWPRPFFDQEFFIVEGFKCIRDNPLVLLNSLRYVSYLFISNLNWPSNVTTYKVLNRTYEYFFVPFLLPGLLLCFWMIYVNRGGALAIPAMIVVSLFLNSYLLKAEFRYRVAFDGVIIPMIVSGWLWAGQRLCPGERERRGALWLAWGFAGVLACYVTFRLYVPT